MKIILDTNIFISGLLLPKSDAGKILEIWNRCEIEVVTSDYLLNEIQRVLTYTKIAKRLNWNEKQIIDFIGSLSLLTTLVNIKDVEANVPKDENDNKILATLIASNADYLVTGDTDLLSLRDQYPIISLADLIEIL